MMSMRLPTCSTTVKPRASSSRFPVGDKVPVTQSSKFPLKPGSAVGGLQPLAELVGIRRPHSVVQRERNHRRARLGLRQRQRSHHGDAGDRALLLVVAAEDLRHVDEEVGLDLVGGRHGGVQVRIPSGRRPEAVQRVHQDQVLAGCVDGVIEIALGEVVRYTHLLQLFLVDDADPRGRLGREDIVERLRQAGRGDHRAGHAADRNHGRRGRPGAEGRCLADLVQLGLQDRIARVGIHLEARRVVALEGSDEQDLLGGALLTRILLVGDGGGDIAEETADTLGNAAQRLARLRDDVLGEDQRLARLILE